MKVPRIDQIDKKVSDENTLIHIVYIDDQSGSMWPSKIKASNEGINAELRTLSDTFKNFTVTLVEFGSLIKRRRWMSSDVSEVPEPSGDMGGTALTRAIYETLSALPREGDHKFLIKIFTDGQENASQMWPKEAAGQIQELKERGDTVTFVGTEDDVALAIKVYGVDASNTFVMENSYAGVKMSRSMSSANNAVYAASVASGKDVTMDFYSKSTEDETETKSE